MSIGKMPIVLSSRCQDVEFTNKATCDVQDDLPMLGIAQPTQRPFAELKDAREEEEQPNNGELHRGQAGHIDAELTRPIPPLRRSAILSAFEALQMESDRK